MSRTSSFRLAAVGALTLASTFGMTACGKASDKVADKVSENAIKNATGGSVDVNSDNDSVKIKTKDGEYSASTSKKLPDGWPAAILPIPPGLTIENVIHTATTDGSGDEVILSGKADPTKVGDFFASAFKKNNVTVNLQSSTANGGIVSGTKGNTTYQVTISGNADDLKVLMMAATSKAPTS